MRFHVVRFHVMRFRAPSADAPGTPARGAVAAGDGTPVPPGLASRERHIGHPTAESQQAGLDHLIRIAMEQAGTGSQLTTLRITNYYSG